MTDRLDYLEAERAACAVIRGLYGWSSDIDDLLAIARAEALEVIRGENAQSQDNANAWAIRRAKFRAIDFLRRAERCDPVRRARRLEREGRAPTPTICREPTAPINARIPISLKARLHKASDGNLSEALRNVIEEGLKALEG